MTGNTNRLKLDNVLSPGDESRCSADVFLCSQLDYGNCLLIDINCDQMYRLQKVQNHTARVVFHKSRHEHGRPLFFTRAGMNMVDHCSRDFTGCQSKKGLFSR